jgi:hypothetical protein
MVADVMLGPGGLDEAAARPSPTGHDTLEQDVTPVRARWGRRVTALVLLILAGVVTALLLLVSIASWLDDNAIDAHEGTAVADVLSVSFNRTAVRFVTPNGTVAIPSAGVLYPTGLVAGERVRVEYDTQNTDLARVAGRTFTLSFLPVGTGILIVWAVALPLVWLLRRRRRTG